MEYLSSSGLWVPVGLSRAVGATPTVQGDGTIGWQVPAGGVGGWDPNGINASPSALDAEFNNHSASSWPVGWTAQGGGDFAVTTFPNVSPCRFTTQPAATGWRGRTATCPAAGTDFILAARVGVIGPTTGLSLAGIGFGTTTTMDSGSFFHHMAGYHGGISAWAVATETGAGFQKNWGAVDHLMATGVTLYIRRVGTNYYSGWSADGLIGVEDVARTQSFTPTQIFIGAYGDRSNDAYIYIKWVRFRSGSGTRIDWGA